MITMTKSESQIGLKLNDNHELTIGIDKENSCFNAAKTILENWQSQGEKDASGFITAVVAWETESIMEG